MGLVVAGQEVQAVAVEVDMVAWGAAEVTVGEMEGMEAVEAEMERMGIGVHWEAVAWATEEEVVVQHREE